MVYDPKVSWPYYNASVMGNWTPDLHPAVPNAADDEFEGAALDTTGTRFAGATAWEFFNQGSSTCPLANGHAVLTTPSDGVMTLRGIRQAAPSAPWIYQAKLNALSWERDTTNVAAIAVFNNNKVLLIDVVGTSVAKLVSQYWSDATTFDSGIANQQWMQIDESGTHTAVPLPMVLRMASDGTTITFSVSSNGAEGSFFAFASDLIADHLAGVTHVGLIGGCTTGTTAAAAWDYFRRIS